MRRHLCALLPEADRLERLRRTWDPAMAAVVPAHVTLAYPEETSDEALLLQRAEQCTAGAPPIRLRLGAIFAEDGGVFATVHDPDGRWATLRERLLAPPMTPVDFPPHATVAHPRTSGRAAECRTALAGRHLDGEHRVREILFTETTANTWTVLCRFPLPGPDR